MPVLAILTVEDRILALTHALTLIQLALAADNDDAGVDMEDVVDALRPVVLSSVDHLYWLKCAMPTEILLSPAPTESEREAAKKAGVQ